MTTALKVSSIPTLSLKKNPEYELSLRSPCKVNLFLRITGKRPNGYHDLSSLFQTISLSDYMHFSKLPIGATRDELECSDPTLQVDDSNLVVKALNLMRSKSSFKNAYFRVRLDKIVPLQAGLGGGSGNAATAMFAFNKLTGFTASLADLQRWSGDIGSDITFFFSTGTAYCTGRGEIVEPLPPLPKSDANALRIHVFKPSEGLSTKLVFQSLDIKSMCSQTDPTNLLNKFNQYGPLAAATDGGLINDLEPPAFKCSSSLAQFKKEVVKLLIAENITKEESTVMMSGSGTSIYALTDNKQTSLLSNENFKQFIEKYNNLKYFECTCLSKKNSVDAWYED